MLRSKQRHLFWGLLAYFYKEFIVLAILIFVKVVVGFAGPLGINRLLTYIETGGKDAVVKPWVWISWLLIGPLVGSTAMQWYIFINTRTLVRIECIITQLVFEHSLRIRMKEEVPTSEKPSDGTTAVPTPESTTHEPSANGHQDSEVTHVEGNGQSTSQSTISKSKGKDQARKDTSRAPSVAPSTATSEKKGEKQENLVGKINNFISTDLGNITEARDLLFMIWYTPLQIVICVWFLYSILGVAYVQDLHGYVLNIDFSLGRFLEWVF
jgi:ABC-type multidrug transport system fused ATPase/permease subunit